MDLFGSKNFCKALVDGQVIKAPVLMFRTKNAVIVEGSEREGGDALLDNIQVFLPFKHIPGLNYATFRLCDHN